MSEEVKFDLSDAKTALQLALQSVRNEQAGAFCNKENELVMQKLQEAMYWYHAGAVKRKQEEEADDNN